MNVVDIALSSGGHTPRHALQLMQLFLISAFGLPLPLVSLIASKAQLETQMPHPVHLSIDTVGIGAINRWDFALLWLRPMMSRKLPYWA